jgi:MarR family transcriptional regulator, organic hydroperoxide resistance regulator
MTTIGREGATDRSDLTNQIIAEFGSFFRELKCMGSDRMRRGGVSSAHFHLLAMLDRHGEMAMSRVAEVLDVSLSNASGLIDRLEERGLVERIRVPDDRRIVLVKLTGTGRKTLGEAEVLKEELVGRVLRRLDSTQLDRLNEALTDLKAAVRATLDSDPSWQAHAQAHASFHAVAYRGEDRPSQPTEVIAGEV